MNIEGLQQDRFLRKDPNQNDQTKGAAYAAINPAPKRGDDALRKIGRPKGSEEDDGAPNILTGTVITSCFIQTSALPSRIEMQGNDLTFFDDTYEEDGVVIGDTSRLIFTHASGKEGDIIVQGFIMEKRASIHDTYDNVFSFYALPPKQGKMNYMYFGREGTGTYQQTNYIEMIVNHSSDSVTQESANGVWAMGGVIDGAAPTTPNFGLYYNTILGLPSTVPGYSLFMNVTGTDGAGLNGQINMYGNSWPIMILGSGGTQFSTEIALGGIMYPLNQSGPTDLGTAANGFNVVYASQFGSLAHKAAFFGVVAACPLPTIPNALETLEKIKAPREVGDRGHFGPGIYFDDIDGQFPEELMHEINGKKEIEHTKMIGFLTKVVIEQNEIIKDLKSRVETLEAN